MPRTFDELVAEADARVLMPGGTYFAQHVGVIYLRTLIESFVGAQPRNTRGPIRGQLNPDTVSAEVAAPGWTWSTFDTSRYGSSSSMWAR
jgi:hypothetical protein